MMPYGELAEKLHSLSRGKKFGNLALATDEQLEGFEPTENCHDNAKRWITQHRQHRVSRGFLIINDNLFIKHSVIDRGSLLLDITPRPHNESRDCLRFIEFDGGSCAAFDAWPAQVLYGGSLCGSS